jgi:tetratricopeptide (TPR) repeat protein
VNRSGWRVAGFLAWVLAQAQVRAAETRVPPLRVEKGVFVAACGSEYSEDALPALPVVVPCVESWLELRDLTGSHPLHFLYYDPAGSLYISTKEDWKLEGSKRKNYHRSVRVRHRLPVAGEQASLLPGTWRVVVVLDDIAVAEGGFRLERPFPPELAGLAEGRELYLGLQYERAVDQIRAQLDSLEAAAARAEARWWLSLSLLSLGRREEAKHSLGELLDSDPTYAVSPERARETGAEELSALLEELRGKRYPELYRKTAAPPEAELSKAERAPVVKKRRPLWKKLVYYVGIPIATLAALGLVAAAIVEERLSNPAFLTLAVDETRAEREPLYGNLCEGAMPLQLELSGGEPPFELLIWASRIGGNRPVAIPGIVESLDGPRVLSKSSPTGSTSLELPAIDVQGAGAGSARLFVVGVLRDRKTPRRFDSLSVGQAVPADLQMEVRIGDPLDRLVSQAFFEVLASDCQQRE